MEELSQQFVDTVRNHLDSVGIPITNVETTYNNDEHDDKNHNYRRNLHDKREFN